ncbi:MAG TPA: 2Fe-2S iron-sulfur cluster-binding protein [Chitinophaga sp.]|uniref:flavin reductase family protein n=1 Tax=Chitinophaga sp. TaxID=1869181 RepID=UPI002B5DF610|nr:2Fe-2S iron-sulfur cluster-binding protein [Chitinophaga sp.]HVI47136.1 2Fe-2S iron-sulfur cluster-binding protein [Chitinophaga sp.]
MADTYTWSTAAVLRETSDTVTVVFHTNGTPITYSPGQFVNITLRIGGEPVTRSYSLSSIPGDPPAITVKRVQDGLMSNYIADNAAGIKEWQVSGPYGTFMLPDHITDAKHLVLLAGGSGITPLFSIARAFTDRFQDAAVTLIYSSGTEIIFREQISAWTAQHSHRTQVHYAMSKPAPEEDMTGMIRGRVNKLIAKKLIKAAVPELHDGTHYFICGPAELMKMHHEMLDGMGIANDNIYLEWFAPDEEATTVTLPEEQQEVLLHFREQSNLLEVHPGQTILDAALTDKIPLPYSCKTGTCGSCAARLISGRVMMQHNYALRKTDVDQGWVLLCQGYPLTGDVTLEME